MREYILKNTNVSAQEYDAIMNYQGKEEDMSAPISLEPKKLTLWVLKQFSLNPPTALNRLKWHIKKNGDWYNFNGIDFKLMYEFYKDPELYSLNRYGKCYEKSFSISLNSKLNIGVAICKSERNFEFLHAFLLGLLNGEEVVLDYTLNLILKKEDYYHLLDVLEISYIYNSELKELTANINSNEDMTNSLLLHEVLCFPKELNNLALKLKPNSSLKR